MRQDLLATLWCPQDHGDLVEDTDAARCTACGVRYPVIDGVLSFLTEDSLAEQERAEQKDRDQEAVWYDSIWPEYIDKVELPAHAEAMGHPRGPVLDLGSGPGRITEYLARELGYPTLALDYSLESLRLLVARCQGLPVLAVHADGQEHPQQCVPQGRRAHFQSDGPSLQKSAPTLRQSAPAEHLPEEECHPGEKQNHPGQGRVVEVFPQKRQKLDHERPAQPDQPLHLGDLQSAEGLHRAPVRRDPSDWS